MTAGASRRPAGYREEVLERATAIEGHPDNVAASLHGGFVVCAGGDVTVVEPPAGLEAVALVPAERVPTGVHLSASNLHYLEAKRDRTAHTLDLEHPAAS